ncbi:branched-chain amino acid ABC transporter substrate-binding protein [Deinococcus cellulosilyticus]|uniref:Branched chain amino acid ABC transporter substrate-binding protein n=1 Tax=Deinococcus cellulosilyticus (strain DSM 18568 / NBRC 106333 / KACC 11606 / 5516J-15) TaxID=1223518 RepID=A0A511N176_DEIC1|nr:branched-chain amino acid ABC transporter substrate-binding protein [Deinococcus cellulosilyticus]GEM46612.1 branched chain amino acid ABC transporter substrate-binding protein [Deinococcus cellulosilyticus NBRC 106333 = KACC 11606]
MKKIAIGALLLLGAAQATDAPSQMDDGGSGGKTLHIAIVGPYSKNDPVAEQIRMATELALEEAKDYISVNFGWHLDTITVDDEDNLNSVSKVLKKLSADNRLVGVVTASNSDITAALVEQLSKDRIPVISSTATSNSLTERNFLNFNRLIPRESTQGAVVADFMKKSLSAKKVYILNDKTSTGEDLATAVRSNLTQDKVEVVSYDGIPDKTYFAPTLIKIRNYKPDVIFYGGNAELGAELVKALRDADISTPFVGGAGLDTPTYTRLAGKAAVGTYFSTVVGPIEGYAYADDFLKNFKKTYKKEATGWAILAYDSAKVMIKGIARAAVMRDTDLGKVPSNNAIMDGIRGLSAQDLATGDVRFNKKGDRSGTTLFIMKVGTNLEPTMIRKVGAEQ